MNPTQVDSAIEIGPDAKRLQRRYKLAFPLTTIGVGLCFGSFNTYITFQIQAAAYFVGHEPGQPPGTGCNPAALACLIPFGGSGMVNLTSFILYLNAIVYAVSGVVILIISGIGDRIQHHREQYVGLLVMYGALALPVAALRGYKISEINALAALYVSFNVIGFIAGPYMNAFIPFAMELVESSKKSPPSSEVPLETIIESGNGFLGDHDKQTIAAITKERVGLSISIWGYTGLFAGNAVPLIIVIGATYFNSTDAGLYMTTACGGICIVLAALALRFLPIPSKKHGGPGKLALQDSFAAIKTLWLGVRRYPEAFKYLLAFVIYNDAFFAFIAVTGQLFNLQIRPSLREFSVYSVVGPLTSMVASIVFLVAHRYIPYRWNLTLCQWTIVCYGLTMFCAIWGAVGISETSKIGLKHRWEFYFLQVLLSMTNGIVSSVFRVVFPQMFPSGDEVQFFGFQLALSCLTVWIPQIVNGPIVDATNNIRLPAAMSIVFFAVSMGFSSWTNVKKGIEESDHEKA